MAKGAPVPDHAEGHPASSQPQGGPGYRRKDVQVVDPPAHETLGLGLQAELDPADPLGEVVMTEGDVKARGLAGGRHERKPPGSVRGDPGGGAGGSGHARLQGNQARDNAPAEPQLESKGPPLGPAGDQPVQEGIHA